MNKSSEKFKSQLFMDFYKSLLLLRNEIELMNFFKDLMTAKELEIYVRRLKAANLLEAGSPYKEIERNTGLSSATIAKVSQALKYGYDGYKLIIERKKKRK